MSTKYFAIASTILAAASFSAFAQTQQSGAAVIPEGPGLFYRIDEGLFQINERQVVDVSDVKITFMFYNDGSDREPRFRFYISGSGTTVESLRVGQRVDFKRYRVTAQLIDDREQCFIDTIQLQATRGAKAVGVFRLECL